MASASAARLPLGAAGRVADCPQRMIFLLDQLSKAASRNGTLPMVPISVDAVHGCNYGRGQEHERSSSSSSSVFSRRSEESRARQEFVSVWNVYATNAKDLVGQMDFAALAAIVRSCCRVGFTKHSLFKRVCDRAYALMVAGGPSSHGRDPRLFCQFLHDLAKLGYLKADLFFRWRHLLLARSSCSSGSGSSTSLSTSSSFGYGLKAWRTFDLPLLVTTLARAGLRDVELLAAISREYARRGSCGGGLENAGGTENICALLYGCAMLNFWDANVRKILDQSRTCYHDLSTQERVNLAFAILVFRVVAQERAREDQRNQYQRVAGENTSLERPAAARRDLGENGTPTPPPPLSQRRNRQTDHDRNNFDEVDYFQSLISSLTESESAGSVSEGAGAALVFRTNPRARHQLRILAASLRVGLIAPPAREQLAVAIEDALVTTKAKSNDPEGQDPDHTNVHRSVFQKSARRAFEELGIVYKEEVPVGPYQVDYLLKNRVAVEFDGFSHFHVNFDVKNSNAAKAKTIPETHVRKAKTVLKHALLEAMGVRVISIAHGEWLPHKHLEQRKQLLVDELKLRGQKASDGGAQWSDIADFQLTRRDRSCV